MPVKCVLSVLSGMHAHEVTVLHLLSWPHGNALCALRDCTRWHTRGASRSQ